MRARFWYERWQQNQIGFHQPGINSHLQEHWARVEAPAGSCIFVPLCGKSRDMLWLRSQGHQVLGIELSPIAVKDFFAENDLQPTVTQLEHFERWEVDGLAILLGDFFRLSAADVADCSAMFDRASLIAMPEDMRELYAAHILRIFPQGRNTLLITIEYDQSITFGPPFSVAEAEVSGHYSGQYSIERLQSIDASADLPGLINKGVPHIDEHVYLLKPRQATFTDKPAGS